jgi:hypothetical protein
VSIPRALLLVLALLQATGVADAMRRNLCAAECRADGCEDDCAPGTDSSSCACHCPSLQPRVPAPIVLVTIAAEICAARAFAADDTFYPSPDPREISHVPRRSV